ncbi:oligopeptide ABC transporter substrate-binding protein [Lysinibacillus sp. NPDC097287]|uniref:oligopeptide ABC transporter substrate-binding protein n=1 Tax=Lysinibacillus sp. NPDC097287 TaxID=3364144 RepID=UPI003808FDBF
MRGKSLFLLLLFSLALLILSACYGREKETSTMDIHSLPLSVTNEGEVISGGTLKVALVTDSPFQGIFLAELYEDAFDAEIFGYASNSLFEIDGDFLVKDTGIAKLDVHPEQNKATVTIRKGVKWSDGLPLTVDDLIYSYEIIGHPDYTGIRYDGSSQNIVGMTEYHEGKAKTISGIKKINDQTIDITFKKITPAIYSIGDGLWGYAAPKHQLQSIAVKDLLSSEAVRKNPVTLGAFKFDKVINGESVQFVANENYYKGKPKLEKVVVQAVPSTSVSEALKAGKYDIATPFPTNQFDSVKNLSNVAILGRPEMAYSYLGFKLGTFDTSKKINVYDSSSKMNEPKLLQAIAYGMDIETVTEVIYQGLHKRANSLIPPVFSFYDASLKGYTYDAKKAQVLLDEAGFIDIDGDGYRENQKGEKLVIQLAAMAGSDVDEVIVAYYRQNWADIGLNVELTTGRLIEFNNFYQKVQSDDPEIDMFMAAWGTGTNPSPSGLYAKEAAFNFSRFVSEDLTKILEDIDSEKSMVADYRSKAFRIWQDYMDEQAIIIPMYFRTEIIPVNKRVKNYNVDYQNGTELQDIELTNNVPFQ